MEASLPERLFPNFSDNKFFLVLRIVIFFLIFDSYLNILNILENYSAIFEILSKLN